MTVQDTSAFTEEATSRYAQAGDVRVHYNEAGDGPALVLLHGGGPGASSWSNFKQNLPALSRHFRCLLVDMPGYGKTDKPLVEEPIWDFNTTVLRDMLDALGIDKAHFAGNSHGGATAVKMAMNHPDRVDRVISMGGGALTVKLFTPLDIYQNSGQAQSQAERVRNPTRESVRAALERLVRDPASVTDDIVEERFQVACDPDHIEFMLHVFSAWARRDGTGPIPDYDAWRHIDKIPHRTLLIWGRDDQVNPLDGTFFALQQMPDCRLYVLPDCGHWVMVEKRDEFDRAVIAFLEAK